MNLNAMIQTSDVEILMSQADRGVSMEIVGAPPIEDSAGVIAELPEGEEQSVAEVGRYSGQVWDRNHLLLLFLSPSLSLSLVIRLNDDDDEIWKYLPALSSSREREERDLNSISSPFWSEIENGFVFGSSKHYHLFQFFNQLFLDTRTIQ